MMFAKREVHNIIKASIKKNYSFEWSISFFYNRKINAKLDDFSPYYT